jgi:aspartate aminotransferase-like enzyme
MISKIINFSTGPLQLPGEVRKSLSEDPISHRSPDFRHLLRTTADLFKEKFSIRHFYLLSGSGTLANEVMIQQIRMTRQKGLILCNGEFGNRLITQATASRLDFISYEESLGKPFDPDTIQEKITSLGLHWILFCHCETSSGIINDLQTISLICTKNRMGCYVDCISTLGTMDINLSGVTMATASSGKGLCGLAGLAIILSNHDALSDGSIPNYLDLHVYQENAGVPFTISSLLVNALQAGSRIKLNAESFQRTANYAGEIRRILKTHDLLPYENFHVFTLASSKYSIRELGERLKTFGILSSYQSEYLEKRNWLQLALFGSYSHQEERWGINRLNLVLEDMVTNRSKIKGHFFEMVFEMLLNKSLSYSSRS